MLCERIGNYCSLSLSSFFTSTASLAVNINLGLVEVMAAGGSPALLRAHNEVASHATESKYNCPQRLFPSAHVMASEDPDITMSEEKSITMTSEAISDNPLDAPNAPRPSERDTTSREDEDMGGTGTAEDAETKQENGSKSPEKDVKAANGAPAVATTAVEATEGTIGAVTAASTAVADQPAQSKSSLESSARSHLIAQTHSIILPSYSTWFDMHTIHSLERKALPEFFNNRNRSKTHVIYKDYRDFMINTYRLNPSEYLTVTACRRNLAGDVCAIMRVHAFLEQWGLINYQIDPDTRPSSIGPPFTGHFRITADTPRGLQPFQPAPNAFPTAGKPFPASDRALTTVPASKTDLNLEIRRNIYDPSGKDITPEAKPTPTEGSTTAAVTTNGEANRSANGDPITQSTDSIGNPSESRRTFWCWFCGVDCTRVRFHCVKTVPASSTATGAPASAPAPSTLAVQAPTPAATQLKTKQDICPNCFLDGHFPATTSASDFVKLEDSTYTAIPARDAPWTDAELLLLLEGLEMYDENWSSVAEHVGTRSREECVLKFLGLEIEDRYLEDGNSGIATTTGILGGGISGGGRLPFAQADNPVMSVVAFLAGLGDQKIAAAAAGRSVEEMRKGLRKQIESPSAQQQAKSKAEGSTTGDTDAMDLDDVSPSTGNASAPARGATANEKLTTIPLATTASRAAALASHEERALSRLVSGAVNTTLQKFEHKLKLFNDMEAVLQRERRELERGRRELFLERVMWRRAVEASEKEGKIVESDPGLSLGFRDLAVMGADIGGGLPSEEGIKAFEI